ncbi:DUF3883 domain-containing protein [Vibrio cholerae]|uniref:DUF3883 domain-containing protein n=1 Tax=Vibrio metoecus TaxID=1481663 RepID=UPI000AA5BC2A|nr:DUF3883 domain-containing protein [Vibrio metoecus]EJL6321901.1 DUF3883 domain-containing protein [Vibrio cholerae]EKG0042487.1 DUF3883 domain-containing protein [Vibrio cholerae]
MMDVAAQVNTIGSYTANLLGNIRSHLAGLQGYDVMALELIQNADDAKAESVVFDVTDSGLFVSNSGQFTYCGDLNSQCAFLAKGNYKCDYHRITDVGSGGKLTRSENIGRFGIGFVSTYQVTDHPEIRSNGIKLTLQPEKGQWQIEPLEQPEGTTFFLPWADDPNTEARLALGVSHVSTSHIDQLVDDFQKVLRKSLLFLRHVRTAELRRNGELVLACDLERGDESDLIVSFRPSGEVEQWHILRADAAESAARLYATHPRLESLGRGTKISIGLRIDPEPLAEGLLYAFLPTEQSTGLPLHINADFFPESDRKALIFAGHQHEQVWNEMLIEVAATELARDTKGLQVLLGEARFWQLMEQAYGLSKPSNYPLCFNKFWEQISIKARETPIIRAHDETFHLPSNIFFPDISLDSNQLRVFQEIGGSVIVDGLRQFRTVLVQLGTPLLTFERLVSLLNQTMGQQEAGTLKVEESRIEDFYRPLWGIINELFPTAVALTTPIKKAMQQLEEIPFLLTEDLYAVTIQQTCVAPITEEARGIATLLPRLAIASSHLLRFANIKSRIKLLTLEEVVGHIEVMLETEAIQDVIGVSQQKLRDLYYLLAELDRQNLDEKIYDSIRQLPIWLTTQGLTDLTNVLLPGNFNDPTGIAELIDASVLSGSIQDFLVNKLGVQTQTIEAFVQNVLPRFFNEEGPLDASKYARLIGEIANYPALVNDEGIRRLLGALPIIPTQDGNWSRPTKTYRRTDDLVRVLGDATSLWLDTSRVPNTRSVHSFIDSIGLRRSPMAEHLVERMLFIAEKYLPTEDAKRASGEAFYVLCDRFDEWKEQSFFLDAINNLKRSPCFPAVDDDEGWYSANSLYAPYRAEAFASQASVLDFRNMARLNRDLLKMLNVALEPETSLVINHLRHCVSNKSPAPFTTYQILNERSKDEGSSISTLFGEPFIYIESQKGYVRSNQLFWMPQQLGRYAFTIPGNLETFKPLFNAIGVKNAPEGRDYVDILLDIVAEYFEQSKPVTGLDRSVYEACLIGIAASDEGEELGASDIRRLQEAPSILNLMGQPTHPDELLLQDSEWHAGFFNGELDRALCKPAPELWPFIEKVGVRRLSESAEVALEFVDGPKTEEPELANKLMERIDILARLLHDKPTTVRHNVRKALSDLTAVSHELVRIQASVHVGGDWVSAPPSAAHAFYDVDKRQLILARPVGDRSWAHVLNAIFHQLMPEESGIEISKLTLSVRPLMSMPVEEAHRELTDAGIPYLDTESGNGQFDDLTSSNLNDMGSAADQNYPPENKLDTVATPLSKDGERTLDHSGTSQPTGEPNPSPKDGQPPSQVRRSTGDTEASNKDGVLPDASDRSSHNNVVPTGDGRAKKPRPKHKEQWDRRLLSYVRKKQGESPDADEQHGPSEHNLAVEVVARAAVCAYEKARGRIAEQMAQTHPGYDIISRNPLTGEDRFIEVKGVNGEWNQTGVGLSRLQFSNAQDYGDRYWLYVVEFVSDPEHMRVHPIQSPATQITAFMFDGNWRDAVTAERADPSARFIPGARIQHQDMGCGEIRDVVTRGNTKLLTILFDGKSQATPHVTLNLHRMCILGD